MAVAALLADAGRSVEVLDDQIRPGGSLNALAKEDTSSFASVRAGFDRGIASKRIRLRSRTTAAAVYGRDLLVVGESGAEILEAKALVLACGAHDGALAFESYARAAGSFAKIQVVHGEPIAIKGTSGARGVKVRTTDGKVRSVEADAVLIDAARSPAYELCQQAGASLVHDPRGFIVETDRGRIAADGGGTIWATGEVSGLPLEAKALEDHARMIAEQIAAT